MAIIIGDKRRLATFAGTATNMKADVLWQKTNIEGQLNSDSAPFS